ncbi:uncharacterized protein LOC136022767 isoform X2 [Lathamus discolor]|uniref:uncharacterized protein LOC136022767 isoform X2 n=1 Tax=Lathamus discolor TaxID=678569 RepID=UPI0032B878D7
MLGKPEQGSLLRPQPRGRAVGAALEGFRPFLQPFPSFLQPFFLSLHFASPPAPPANSHHFPSPTQPHPLIPRGGIISAPVRGKYKGKWLVGQGNGLVSSLRALRKMNLAFAVLVAWALSPAHGSLWDLHKMITKATGKNALLHYSFYGCYCGFGGKGQPKDATDRCCQLHDTCYDSLLSHHCNAKAQSYLYDWAGSSPSCSE